jgi:FlaA1/EpsC-like NDP-sugar epimerase
MPWRLLPIALCTACFLTTWIGTFMHAALAEVATWRTSSMFAADMVHMTDTLMNKVKGKRILAIGAAGSIGSNTAHTMATYSPAALHIIDQNENALAEFVRQHWSRPQTPKIGDFRTLPLDFGSPTTKAFLASQPAYDIVLNFAAIKHVRSEKDPFSILQMIETNIVKQARFMRAISAHSPQASYFSVSTDKAANPSSFMGATKRIMEHILFDPTYSDGFEGPITSARFANVAFSNGSLLQGWENRLLRQEPLACPKGIKRYFVSLEESGHICTLASLLVPDRHIAIPKLDPSKNLVDLLEVADRFLALNGKTAKHCETEAEAKAMIKAGLVGNIWPIIATSADTSGEKPYEEFVAKGEQSVSVDLSAIEAVPWSGLQHGGSMKTVVEKLADLVDGNASVGDDRSAIKAILAEIEPEFLGSHVESTSNLDQRA